LTDFHADAEPRLVGNLSGDAALLSNQRFGDLPKPFQRGNLQSLGWHWRDDDQYIVDHTCGHLSDHSGIHWSLAWTAPIACAVL
jgi:hypothetical protein